MSGRNTSTTADRNTSNQLPSIKEAKKAQKVTDYSSDGKQNDKERKNFTPRYESEQDPLQAQNEEILPLKSKKSIDVKSSKVLGIPKSSSTIN